MMGKVLFKNEKEFQHFMKPPRERRLKEQLGDDGFKLLEKALKDNERLHKQMRAMETRIENIMARLIRLELRGESDEK